MNFLKNFLANLMTNKMFAKISQEQNEALLDCLALAISIDGEVDPDELEELRDAFKLFSWRGEADIDAYVDQAIAKAADIAVDEAALRAYGSDIAARLQEDWLCDEAYYISARISTANHDIHEHERMWLNALVESLGISRVRLQNITQKLMAETKFA